jgi:hypothetical protein
MHDIKHFGWMSSIRAGIQRWGPKHSFWEISDFLVMTPEITTTPRQKSLLILSVFRRTGIGFGGRNIRQMSTELRMWPDGSIGSCPRFALHSILLNDTMIADEIVRIEQIEFVFFSEKLSLRSSKVNNYWNAIWFWFQSPGRSRQLKSTLKIFMTWAFAECERLIDSVSINKLIFAVFIGKNNTLTLIQCVVVNSHFSRNLCIDAVPATNFAVGLESLPEFETNFERHLHPQWTGVMPIQANGMEE